MPFAVPGRCRCVTRPATSIRRSASAVRRSVTDNTPRRFKASRTNWTGCSPGDTPVAQRSWIIVSISPISLKNGS